MAEAASRGERLPGGQYGFSLLEIMVVVVIIGILVSIFTLSVGSFAENETEEHARRLEALIRLASEEAAIQGREIGLRFYQHGYEFSGRVLSVDEKGQQEWLWVPLDNDRLLLPRNLSEDFAIELQLDGKETELEFQRSEPKKDKPYLPQVFVFSSGEIVPPFNATIRRVFSDEQLTLSVSADSKLEIMANEL